MSTRRSKILRYVFSLTVIIFLVVFIVSIINGIVSERRSKSITKQHEIYVDKIINENDFLKIKTSNPQLYIKITDCFSKNVFLLKKLFNTISDTSFKIGFFSLIISVHQVMILYLLRKIDNKS